MSPKRYSPYAPPVSLRDLCDRLGVAALGALVAALPGAVEMGTKHNETWRYELGGCLVIGYRESAVVAGDSAALVPIVAARVRAAAGQPAPVPTIIRPRIVPPVDVLPSVNGASYNPLLDWTHEESQCTNTINACSLSKRWFLPTFSCSVTMHEYDQRLLTVWRAAPNKGRLMDCLPLPVAARLCGLVAQHEPRHVAKSRTTTRRSASARRRVKGHTQ